MMSVLSTERFVAFAFPSELEKNPSLFDIINTNSTTLKGSSTRSRIIKSFPSIGIDIL